MYCSGKYLASLLAVLLMLLVRTAPASETADYDVVVYGSTPAGVTAAVQARRMGKRAVLISPKAHLGGMTSGGLGWADVGDQKTIGGLCEEFFHRVYLYYQRPEAWKFVARDKFAFAGQHGPGKDDARQIMIIFEPHVAEKAFDDMVADAQIPVVRGRLDLRPGGVEKQGARITGLRLEDGRVFRGAQFIDASYEGDLMARAGVRYIVGREPNELYGEKINGVQVPASKTDALNVSAYVVPGKPESGMLPGIAAGPGGPKGSGDHRIQAYCYRLCLTDAPENRLPIEKPADYREADYELLFRAIEAGQNNDFLKISPMPNRKSDCNNSGFISLDFIGRNYDYPDGDYATRERITREHDLWTRGYVWTIQHSPRVPEAIRQAYVKWGLPKDEYADSQHWSTEFYVREGRRMLGDYVASGKELEAGRTARPVGMASYRMDSHAVQWFVDADGFARKEGGVNQGLKPYQIDYGVMVPKAAECENLLVPVCLSTSHIAYGSIRMEPVFMILGQSAGTAACLAIDGKCGVQAVPYAALRETLLLDKQVLGL